MVATNEIPRPANTVQLLTADGRFQPSETSAEYLPYLERLDENDYRRFYRDMVRVRALDHEAANLQRQGQLGLWVPSVGQEGAQVGSAHAAKPQDHLFPSYREHVVGMVRGIDPIGIIGLLTVLGFGFGAQKSSGAKRCRDAGARATGKQ